MQSYHLGALLAVLSLVSMVVSLEDQQDTDEELLDECMARADQDRDGKVNREEFEEVMLLLRTDLLL
ncbi:hypothetical protein CRUP_005588 [Coryphaenoides rupestris]|nr:hypothetical protein CRUP_005588 [Coryphaenoides rupestris]